MDNSKSKEILAFKLRGILSLPDNRLLVELESTSEFIFYLNKILYNLERDFIPVFYNDLYIYLIQSDIVLYCKITNELKDSLEKNREGGNK